MRIYNIVLAAWVGLTLATAVGVALQQHRIDNLESVLNRQEVRLDIIDGVMPRLNPTFSIEPQQPGEFIKYDTTLPGPAFKHYEQPSLFLSEEEARELMIDPDSSAFSRATEIFISEDYGIETIYIGDFKLSLQGFPLQEGVFYIYMDGRLFEYKGVAE